MQQLDFFRDSAVDYLYGEVQKVKLSNDRVRKSLFGHMGEMQEKLLDLQEEILELKKKRGEESEN